MKKRILYICICVLTCTVSWAQQKFAHVSIDVLTDSPTMFVIWAPVDGVRTIPTDTIKVKGRTVVDFEVALADGLSTCEITSMGKKFSQIVFILKTGGKVQLKYPEDQKLVFSNGSSDYEFQVAYSKLLAERNPYKWQSVRDFTTYPIDTVWSIMQANFTKESDIAKKPFVELLADGKIDRTAYDFVSSDIDYFNAMAMWSVSQLRHDYYGNNAEKMLASYPISTDRMRLPGAYTLASTIVDKRNLLSNKELKNMPVLDRDKYVVAQIYKKIPDTKVAEHLVADFIHYRGINNKTHTRDIDVLIGDFKTKYPNSLYNSHLSRFIAENNHFYKVIAMPFSSNVHFIKDTAGINTLDEVLVKLKGKPIFIDFWFSTCGPCCKEFEYLPELHEFMKKNDIETLFISVDGDNMVENWENTIKLYDLQGWHIRVNRQTRLDMLEKYNIGMFPRYMIVDKDGQIVEPTALRPSSGKELVDQITEKLHISK